MARVAFLTTNLAESHVTDDDLAVPLLRERGAEVVFVPWREPADWAAFDLVVVRSTWDYQRHLPAFLDTLEAIAETTRLENPRALQAWNVRKTYLRDLAADGIAVVPTIWLEQGLEPGRLASLFGELDAPEIVLKPVIGASGEDAFRIPKTRAAELEPELLTAFRGRPAMAQPFLGRVLEAGEVSVVWVDGEPSHALRKTPATGEFRSQEEHGGRVEAIPMAGELESAAARVFEVVRGRTSRPPLYGRVDFLPGPDGLLVGELELVEPSLYLRVDAAAPARFAEAVLRRLE